MDYKNGKIYTIRSNLTDKYYIGSTCSLLSKRLYQHKGDYKKFLGGKKNNISSCEIIKFDDAYIELLEDFKCNSKDQLLKREGELIREHKDDIVNKCIAGRTKKEYRTDKKAIIAEQKKAYRVENKDILAEKHKAYCEKNKDAIAKRRKIFYVTNKDILAEHGKAYYINNLAQIKQKARQKIDCECGSIYSKSDKAKHLKTKKHSAFIM